MPFTDETEYLLEAFLDMFTQLLAPLLGLTVFASASPFLVARQTEPAVGDWCTGLGGDTIDNIDNFTLAAWNSTGSNTNTTGNPLVLSSTGSTGGFSTDTWAVSVREKRARTDN